MKYARARISADTLFRGERGGAPGHGTCSRSVMRSLPLLLLVLAACGTPPEPSATLRIAGEYETYGKVDDTLRWSPGLCRMPPPPEPRLSAAGPSTPHGRKLYHLYAKDWDAYTKGGAQPRGQVIVKEAWEPLPGEGKLRTGKKQGLYIMEKTEAADSDAGWVYATVTPDGRTVTSFGKVASCMSCHVDAPKDRIFGLPGRTRLPGSVDPYKTLR